MKLKTLLATTIGLLIMWNTEVLCQQDKPTWRDQVNNRVRNVLQDRAHHKQLLDSYHAVRRGSAITVQEYEFFNRTQNYGRREELRAVAKSMTEKELGRLLGLEAFKSGLDFEFGFGKKKQEKRKTKRVDTVRYGLVLQDINPGKKRLLMASHNTNDLALAQKAPDADINWKIERLPENETKSYRITLTDTKASERSLYEQIWGQITAPNFKGKVSIDPHTRPSSISELPGQVLRFYQEDGVYQFQAKSDKNFKLSEELHIIHVKVQDSALEAHYNSDFEQQKLSLINWTQINGWSANLHYFPIEKRFSQEMRLTSGSAIYSLNADTKSINPGHIYDDRNKLELKVALSF